MGREGFASHMLVVDLQALVDLEIDVMLAGFSLAEVDLALDRARETSTTASDSLADQIPEPPTTAVSRLGRPLALRPPPVAVWQRHGA